MKRSNMYKYYRLTTLEAPNMLVFSYVLPGILGSIDGGECRVHYNTGRGISSRYWEFDTDLNIQNVGRRDDVKVLYFDGYSYKANINDKKPLVSKTDFNSMELWLAYAIKFCDNGQILILNEKMRLI